MADIADALALMRGVKWDEADHPRVPAGDSDGGQFTESGSGSGEALVERITINLAHGWATGVEGDDDDDEPAPKARAPKRAVADGTADGMLKNLDATDLRGFGLGWSVKRGAAVATMHPLEPAWQPKGWPEGKAMKIDALNTSDRSKPIDTMRLMRTITEAADAEGVTLTLNAQPFNTQFMRAEEIKLSDLKRFYRRYGFSQPRKGSPTFVDYDTMVRPPRTAAEKALDDALDFMRGEKHTPGGVDHEQEDHGNWASGSVAVAERPRTGIDALTIEERRRYGQLVEELGEDHGGTILRREDGVAVIRGAGLSDGDPDGKHDLELTARGLWTHDYPQPDVLDTHVALSDAYDETVYGPPDAEGPADLSEEQFARYEALRRYAGSNESIQLNARLRQKDRLTNDQSAWRDTLDAAVAAESMPRDVTVYRGINLSDYNLVPGTTLTDKGFMSTTLDPTHAAMAARKLHGGRVLLEFTVPKGSKAIYLGAPAGRNWRESEYEVLLPRGMKLRIIEQTTREFFPGKDAETGAATATTYDVYRAEVVPE